MKNLELRHSCRIDFDCESDKKVEKAAIALCDEGIVIYKNGKLWLMSKDNQSEIVDLSSTFEQESTKVQDEICTGLVIITGDRAVLSFKSGLLISVEIGLKTVEVVGNLSVGLEGAWTSPDDELLVLGASDGAVILMTCGDFEPLLEFDPDEATDAAFANVNVGWGAKETQFHGKAGKAAREITQEAPEAVKQDEDHAPKVVWRDDGQYFAVSYVSKIDQVRRIRIFNREGQLQSTSEPVLNLGSSLAWKPSAGALVASSLKMSNGSDVIGFFEKNGLRHGEFPLPKPAHVHNLCWNNDASILAIHLMEKESNEDCVQLWTVSNYKWQLKKSWRFPSILTFKWDPMSPTTLYIFGTEWAMINELKFKIHRSVQKSGNDLSYVAIIDGPILKITPFREMVVPPPISAFELKFKSNIKHVAFSSHPDCLNKMIVITEENVLHVLDAKGEETTEVKLTGAGGQGFVPKCTVLKVQKISSIEQTFEKVCWIDTKTLAISEGSTISIVSINDMSVKETLIAEDTISEIIAHETNVMVILVDGTVLQMENDFGSLVPMDFSIPSNCSQIEQYQNFVIALSDRSQRLYINGTEVGSGITSFYIHSDFLMVTTVKHTLKCLPLSEVANFSKDNLWASESVRALERGSKLVTVVSNDTKTVLQMPRGNLEVIHPRALSLHIIKKLLDKCEYKKTMEILRRQRINLNLIVDHDFELFKNNVTKFVEEMPSMDRLCVFIADLM